MTEAESNEDEVPSAVGPSIIDGKETLVRQELGGESNAATAPNQLTVAGQPTTGESQVAPIQTGRENLDVPVTGLAQPSVGGNQNEQIGEVGDQHLLVTPCQGKQSSASVQQLERPSSKVLLDLESWRGKSKEEVDGTDSTV